MSSIFELWEGIKWILFGAGCACGGMLLGMYLWERRK